MRALQMIQSLIDYHYARNRRLLDGLGTLSEAQFVEPVAYSRGSLRDQMVHMANTDAGWLRGIKEVPGAKTYRLDPRDYPTRQAVHALWEATEREMTEYVGVLVEDDLERRPQDLPATVWQVLVHVVNHGTDHRAQVPRILHDLGAPTSDQDYILHLMGR